MSPTKSVHRSVAILKLPEVVAQNITFAQMATVGAPLRAGCV